MTIFLLQNVLLLVVIITFWVLADFSSHSHWRLNKCLDFITQHYFTLGESQDLKTLTNIIMDSSLCLPHHKTSSPAVFESWTNSLKVFPGSAFKTRGFGGWQEHGQHQHLFLLLFQGWSTEAKDNQTSPPPREGWVFFVIKTEVAFPLETQTIQTSKHPLLASKKQTNPLWNEQNKQPWSTSDASNQPGVFLVNLDYRSLNYIFWPYQNI